MKRLQSLSYKTLFTILFFSLAGIVFFLKIGGKTQKVSAAWWDDLWHYRKAISITNSSGSNLTDFQVSVSIGTSQLIADGKMQSDCDDIRLTDINGNLLPYWIEENNPGCNQLTDTKIWLKANSLPTSGATVYIYYGNTSANNNENGDNVFEYFDNFNDANKTNSNWTTTGTGFTITNGNLYHSTTLEPSNSFASYTINNSSSFTNGVIESRLKPASCGSSYGKGLTARYTDDNNQYVAGLEAWTANQTHIGKRVGSGWTNLDQDSLTCDTNTWYSLQWTLNGTNQYLTANGVASSAVDSSFSSGKVGIEIDNRETPVGAYWDYFFVHKYASSDPTPTLQSEELSPAPIAYWKFDEGVGTTVYDSSGNNNGTLGTGNSAPTWVDESQCVSGKCLSFNGTQSVFSNYDVSWNNTNNISISFWVKPQNVTDTNRGILGKQNPGYEWSFYQNNSAVSLVYWDNSGSHTNGMDDSWGNVLTTNKWTHLVYTWNGSVSNFYSNGKLVKTKIATNPTINRNQTNNMMFGGNIYTWGDTYFKGYIDEVKIYPYARTADQIKQDYNSRGSTSGAGVNLGIKSNTAPSIKSSLIAYYKLDEGNGTKIFNSGSLGSTLNGDFGTSAPTWTNNGKTGKALTFNNKKYIVVTNNNNLIYNQNGFTYSAWIKANTLGGSYNMFMGQYLPYFDIYNNKLHFSMNAAGSQRVVSGQTNISTGQWYYVTATYDLQGYMKVYLNGKLDGTAGPYLTPTVSNQNFYLGTWESGLSYPFDGDIDEVKIYNRALTPEEIKQDYNQGSAIQFGQTTQNIGGTITSLDYCIPSDTSYCAPPVAEWNFEENTGTIVKDTSGNNFNGTFSTGTYAPTWISGKNNKGTGIKFIGESNSSYIETSFPLTSPTSYTAEAWIKPYSINSGLNPSYGYTIFAASYDGSRYPVWVTLRNGEIMTASFVGAYTYGTTSGANIQPNQWYHIAVSATQNNTATIYINGVGKTSFTAGNIAWNTADKLTIGDLRPTRNISFNGVIDDVRIYSYARTPAQVAYDYNRGAPVGWWKFDECQGSVINDSSGNNNIGTLSIGQSGTQNSIGTCQIGTSAAWTNGASGHINSSLNFDGTDDYIRFSNSSSLNFNTSNFTLSTWTFYKPNSKTNIILGKRSYPPGYIMFYNSNNSITVQINDSSGHSYNVGTPLCQNIWCHLTAVINRNSNQLYFYVNGILFNTVDISNTTGSIDNSGWFGIGADQSDTSNVFNGQLDDVRVYNYALTSEQVKQVYNGGAVNFN